MHTNTHAAPGLARRIPLTGRLTPEQVAEHNRFIDEMREQPANLQDYVSRPTRFVHQARGLPAGTTC